MRSCSTIAPPAPIAAGDSVPQNGQTSFCSPGFQFASPPHAYRLLGTLAPWFGWPALATILLATWWGLVKAPADYQQGDGFRIIYVHAPSAWLSLMAYTWMAVAAGIGLIWRMKVAHAVAASCAPVGAWFTVAALCTGMLWGKPMWGTYWIRG